MVKFRVRNKKKCQKVALSGWWRGALVLAAIWVPNVWNVSIHCVLVLLGGGDPPQSCKCKKVSGIKNGGTKIGRTKIWR